jgi:hypothetical protein
MGPVIASASSGLGNVLFAQDDSFIGSPLFFVIGAVIVLGLGGALFYMRSKQGDD